MNLEVRNYLREKRCDFLFIVGLRDGAFIKSHINISKRQEMNELKE